MDRSVRRVLQRTLGIVLALLLVLATIAVWWVGQTTSFVQWALQRAAVASHGAFEYAGLRGTLLGGLRIEHLRWHDAGRDVALRDVSIAWRPDALLQGELRLVRIEIGQASIGHRPATQEPPALPATLELPLSVRLDALGIGRLTIASGQGEPIVLERVSLAAQYRHGVYRVAWLSARSPQWGQASLNGLLGDSPPFDLELIGDLAPSSAGGLALPGVRVLADGTLGDFSLLAQAFPALPAPPQSPPPQQPPPQRRSVPAQHPVWIGLDTRVRPFAPSRAQMLGPVAITFDGVEPAQFGLADAPLARLSGSANVRVGDERIEGELNLANALPGAIDRREIPLKSLKSAFVWSQRVLQLRRMHATLPEGAEVGGEAQLDFARRFEVFGRRLPATTARLTVRDLDLSRLSSRLEASRLSGDLRLEDTLLEVDLADASRRNIELAARVQLDNDTLRLERVRLRTGAGMLSASGTTSIRAPWRIDLAGRFADLDPAAAWELEDALLPARANATAHPSTSATPAYRPPDAWLQRLHGRIRGSWSAQGQAWPEPLLRTSLKIESGTLDGRPLRLDWRGQVDRRHVADVDLDLSYGELRARAQGSLGSKGDRLRFAASAASLERIDPRLGGTLQADGEWLGGWGDAGLGVVADVSGARLQWNGSARIGSFSGRIELPDLDAGRVNIALDARAAQWGSVQADRLRVRADGDVASHRLRIDASGARFAGRLAASGALVREAKSGWRWRGSLDELAATEPVAVRLGAAAPLELGADRFTLGPAALVVDGASVRIDALSLHEGNIETRGEADSMPVGRWIERFAATPGSQRAEGQLAALRVGAGWDLSGPAWQTLSGHLALALHAGEGVEGSGEAHLALDRGKLDGDVDLRIPTLAFANRSIGPQWAVAGRLRFAGRVAGTLEKPQLRGDLEGHELALMQRALGWRLADGTLRARFEGDRLDVQELRLQSGTGSVTLDGQLRLDAMQGDFRLRADALAVPFGPGERVVVSGDTRVTSRGAALQWSGSIRADQGNIELRGGDAPKLPEDVVIVGSSGGTNGAVQPRDETAVQPRDEAAARAANDRGPGTVAGNEGLTVSAALSLDLGEKLRVRGSGVSATLAGKLDLRGTLPAQPRAYGTVSVRKGTYTAYGQRLQITRGKVIFDGPIDNPVLDIVAMRLGQPVEAGVSLTGTVLAPQIRLVSKPDVPDSQKLSWLVLGVGLDDARSGAQVAALQAAAASLLGTSEGGLSGGMAHTLGLDVLTIRGANAGEIFDPDFGATFPGQASGSSVPAPEATQNVVAIGKRLGSRVLVTYEQGLRGVWNLLRIQYDITRRLSVRAQTGTETALDLLYFYSFD